MSAALAPLVLSVPSVWDLLRDVRARVEEHLKSVDADLRDASVMVASELVENAVKYGARTAGTEKPALRLECDDTRVEVTVSSIVSSAPAAQRTVERIAEIRAAEDKRALYISRLREMMAREKPGSSTELGLYRIVGEGEFDLSCRLTGPLLYVTATRRLT